jgi:nucleoside-diphosphate-sugar epimerase
MKVLITGGAGYLGSILTGLLLDNKYKVTVVDNLIYKQLSLTDYCYNEDFTFIKGDVRNLKQLVNLKDYDVIIPLAAIVGMPACDRNMIEATQINYDQIDSLVENTSKDQQLILPNTNSQYGSSTDIITEESPFNPLSHYAKTKCDAELCLLNSERSGVALRLATVFGLSPRMRLDLLVNDFVYRAVTDKLLVLFQASFKRNYIHVRDIANTFLFVIENYDKCVGEPFNVGLSSANLSKLELAQRIKQYIPDLVIIEDEFAEDFDKRNYIVSNEKLESLGWAPSFTLDDGIEELIKGYQFIATFKDRDFTNL